MNSTSRMREALIDQNGDAQMKNVDKLDESILVSRSLSDIADDTPLDDKHGTLTVSNQNICAMKREQASAVRRVTFSDTVDYGTTVAYSTIYGVSPTLVVATANGTIKSVSAMADHDTGKKS